MKKKLPIIFVITFLTSTGLALATDAEISPFLDTEDLTPVVSYGRSPQPVSRIADNVTVITKDEIHRLQSLDDLIKYHTGVSPFPNRMPGDLSMAMVQGFPTRQTLITYDGIPLNSFLMGGADIGLIPMYNIERIEIIKGPAASVWGRSVGAVINFVTSDPDPERNAGGELHYRIGERNTDSGYAVVNGTIKESETGYYIAGFLGQTDGFQPHVSSDRKAVYGKITQHLGTKNDLNLLYARSYVMRDLLQLPLQNLDGENREDARFYIARLLTKISSSSEFESTLYSYSMDGQINFNNMAPIPPILPVSGIKLQGQDFREESAGVQTAWKYNADDFWITTGFDGIISRLRNSRSSLLPPAYDTRVIVRPSLLGLYFTGGVNLADDLTLTGALRYEYCNKSKDTISPSLGLVYQLTPQTILRTTAGRGYSLPTLGNPEITVEPEELWRYQVGIESDDLPGIWAKVNAFYDRTKNTVLNLFVDTRTVPSKNMVRQGLEIEVKTNPLFDTSISIGYTFLDIYDHDSKSRVDQLLEQNLIAGIHYTTEWTTFDAFGIYDDWNSSTSENAMTFDFLLTQKLFIIDNTTAALQFAIHNAFQGAQYRNPVLPNQPRWIEGGLSLTF